jgi:uncharacterized membrane protein
MTTAADRLVDDYLQRLDAELGDLPRARRRELVGEIAEHIAEARSVLPREGEAEIRTLLDQVGDPADIAAEARERLDVRPRRRGVVEILALIGLLVGGIVLPLLGWFVGLVLLWVSDAWTTREKLVGTFVVPGGLAPAFYLTFAAVSSPESGLGRVLLIAVYLFFVIGPFFTTVFLARLLRGGTPVSYQPSAGSA